MDHPAIARGWWAIEHDGPSMSRWTDGEAVLPLPPMRGPSMLEIELAGAMTYLAKPFSTVTLLPAIELAAARYAETSALRAEIAEATQRLQARKVIDRAKGLLMTQQKMTEPQAFRWLKRTAIDRRTSMDTIARDVIERPADQRQLITVPPAGSSLPGACSRKDEVR